MNDEDILNDNEALVSNGYSGVMEDAQQTAKNAARTLMQLLRCLVDKGVITDEQARDCIRSW